jgi:LppP/LprE lipoprotein
MTSISLRWAASSLCLLLGMMSTLSTSAAQPGPGDWLASPQPQNWNARGGPLPVAPPPSGFSDSRCVDQERWPESAEEEQVVAAGWRLFNAARVGWGLRVVDGLVDYDGMCRPLGFQVFVFADGQFAGTISPEPMDSRTDGVGRVLNVGRDNVGAQFQRYTPSDPLCCPSSTFLVEYAVDRGGPLLVPLSSSRTSSP